ncbi:Dabb family protein [Baaleninema sp.]|uniref:Dabb family protein n=1 Tax=Baaleninema sp. TaxID=3101197 RepID=UPI003CFEFF3A
MNASAVVLLGAALLSFDGGFGVNLAQGNPSSDETLDNTLIRHIVLVDLKSNLSDSDVEEFLEVAEVQLGKIPGVLTVDFGRQARGDRSVHIADYDIAVYMEFESLEALDRYQSHPVHQQFLQQNQHLWNGIRVLDFFGSYNL